MPKPMPPAPCTAAQRTRALLAAAMAAPVLFQLALHGLAPLLPFRHAGSLGLVVAYAASGAAAVAGCMLVARLEAVRGTRTGRKPAPR
ncbi:hypothetical protein LCI23_16680 [Massilia sp. MS-15]|nr:hypothetical protein [Massilia sp. MS-15]